MSKTVKVFNAGKRTIEFKVNPETDTISHFLKPQKGMEVPSHVAKLLRDLYPDEVQTADAIFSQFDAIPANGSAGGDATKEEAATDAEAGADTSIGGETPPADKPLDKMNAAELKKVADVRGLKYNPKATAAQMLALLTKEEAATDAE